MKPSISIVIPTRNRAAILARCLAALPSGMRGLEPCEVIVVDDCSSDETGTVVDQFRDAGGRLVHYLRQNRPRGANAARNAALQIARGEIIAFIDDDVLVTQDWLCKLIAGLSAQFPIVTGPVRLMMDGTLLGKHRDEISSYLSEILVPKCSAQGEIIPVACNMAAYRWVFERARFDENVRPPVEETDWLARAEVRAAFVQEAWVWHCKVHDELKPGRFLPEVWRRGGEGGRWIRERSRIPARQRWVLAGRSLHTSARAFGHAVLRGCWGGVVVGVGELSRALALAGLVNCRPRMPGSWR